MTDTTTAPTGTGIDSGPYARAARRYRDVGWRGVLPVAGKHGNLPGGLTGHDGGWPDDDQVDRWVASRGADNVALRLPEDVIGIDVDAYDGRRGLETLQWFEQTFGELPPTWRSSARDDGSGIRLYRVPTDRRWVSDLGVNSNVEVIRFAHRFAVVWPSVHPQTRTTYRWRDATGAVVDGPPAPTDLPALPDAWIDALQRGTRPAGGRTGGHAAEDVAVVDAVGERVDPRLVLIDGVPVGSQQTELFRYACSLRARGAHREEMYVLLMAAIQVLDNAPDREPWTPADVATLVDRVRDDYQPGPTVPPEVRAFVDGLRADVGRASTGVEVVEEVPREPLATDLGNSLRFARLNRDRVRYAVDVGRWYAWDGRRWATDPDGGAALELTKRVVDAVRAEALAADGDRRARLLRWAFDSESFHRRRATVAGAAAEPALRVTSDVFDRDPDLLVVRNGTVDLRTGQLRPADPADLCSHLAEVDHDAAAEAPRWAAHVDLLCAGDRELVAYLARAVGYSLTGNVGARAFFFLEGDGTNGKNAFVEPVSQLLGSYARTASSTLLTGDERQHETVIADLLGARLVFVDETRQGRQLNVERIKALTGSKRLKGRFMRQDHFEFDARFKLWIAGNGRPTVKDPSDGVWSRLHRVVCKGKIQPDRIVERYGDVLYREEASGILNWALRGLADWRARGLAIPASIQRDVQEYRDEEDYPGQFLGDYVTFTGDHERDFVSFDWLYRLYRSWADDAGLRGPDVLNRSHFGRALAAKNVGSKVRKIDGHAARTSTGISWRADVVDESD